MALYTQEYRDALKLLHAKASKQRALRKRVERGVYDSGRTARIGQKSRKKRKSGLQESGLGGGTLGEGAGPLTEAKNTDTT